MPPSLSAFRRAAIPTLAFAACLPSGAAAQAGPAATTPSEAAPVAPVAGGASLTSAAGPTADRLVRVPQRDLSLSSKSAVAVTVRALTAPVHLELRVGSGGRKVADADLAPGASTVLRGGALRGEALHLLVRRTDGGLESNDITIGTATRTQRMRPAIASWYGPGLFGNRTACGQTLTRGLRGVAHKTLACGTNVTVKFRGRSTRATVVDRGPFHGGREFDLTYATAQAIGFKAVGRVWVAHR